MSNVIKTNLRFVDIWWDNVVQNTSFYFRWVEAFPAS